MSEKQSPPPLLSLDRLIRTALQIDFRLTHYLIINSFVSTLDSTKIISCEEKIVWNEKDKYLIFFEISFAIKPNLPFEMRYALDNEKLTVQEFLSIKYICSSFKICHPRSLSLFLYEKNVAWKQCVKRISLYLIKIRLEPFRLAQTYFLGYIISRMQAL